MKKSTEVKEEKSSILYHSCIECLPNHGLVLELYLFQKGILSNSRIKS